MTNPSKTLTRQKSHKDGLSFICRECNLEQTRKYRKQNKDKYYFDQQAYRSTETGFVSQTIHNCKTRALKKGFEFSLTTEDLLNLMQVQNMQCAVTGLLMDFKSQSRKKANPFKCSVDRIDSSKGYTLDNVRLVCWAVNQMKSDRTEDEFEFWIKSIHKAISSQAP
ncbi:MAG: hypothetical protein IM509_05280 [Microcystis sp. M31BS1]|uniref:hypothetical protein n=1 Tax=Microcystis sp. M31BS1 TaxID=2771186 RepID=UPI002590EDF7|nr:hypothetical protein [Microcystis sp. M31BS1]MCA2590163.1 hypothetical protein [Microcystis sp. M31BS1]